jgi:hypothetical protein
MDNWATKRNKKLFPNYLPSIFHGVLVGVNSLLPFELVFDESHQPVENQHQFLL